MNPQGMDQSLTYESFCSILDVFKSAQSSTNIRTDAETAYFDFLEKYPAMYCQYVLRAMGDSTYRSLVSTLFRRNVLGGSTGAIFRMDNPADQLACAEQILHTMQQLSEAGDSTSRHLAYALSTIYTNFVETGIDFPQVMQFFNNKLNPQSNPVTRRCIMIMLADVADLPNNKLREVGIETVCSMIMYGINEDQDDMVAVEAARACISLLCPNPDDDENDGESVDMQDDMEIDDDKMDARLLEQIVDLIPGGSESIIAFVSAVFTRLQKMAERISQGERSQPLYSAVEEMLRTVNSLIEYLSVIINPCLPEVILLMTSMVYLESDTIKVLTINVIGTICDNVRQLKKKAARLLLEFFRDHLIPVCINSMKEDEDIMNEWNESINNDLLDDVKLESPLFDSAGSCIDSIAIALGKKIVFPVIVSLLEESIQQMNNHSPYSWRYCYLAGYCVALVVEGCSTLMKPSDAEVLVKHLSTIALHQNPRVRLMVLHATAQLSIDCEDIITEQIDIVLENIFFKMVNDPYQRVSSLVPVCIMSYVAIMDSEQLIVRLDSFGAIIEKNLGPDSNIPAATAAIILYSALIRELEATQSAPLKIFMSQFYTRFEQILEKLANFLQVNVTAEEREKKLLFTSSEASYVAELIEAITITAQTFPGDVDEAFYKNVMEGLIKLYSESNIDAEHQITRQCIWSFLRMQAVNIEGFIHYSSVLVPKLLEDLRAPQVTYIARSDSDEIAGGDNDDDDDDYGYSFDGNMIDQQTIVLQCLGTMMCKKPEVFSADVLIEILSTVIFRGYALSIEPELRTASIKLMIYSVNVIKTLSPSHVPELMRIICNNFNEGFQMVEWATSTSQEICGLIDSLISGYAAFANECVFCQNGMNESERQLALINNNESFYVKLYSAFIQYRINHGDQFDEKVLTPSDEAMALVRVPFDYKYFIEEFCLNYLVKIQERLYKTLQSDYKYALDEDDDPEAIAMAIDRTNKNYYTLMDSVCDNYSMLLSKFKTVMEPLVGVYENIINMWMQNKGCAVESAKSPIQARFDSLAISLICECAQYIPNVSLDLISKHWNSILAKLVEISPETFDESQCASLTVSIYCIRKVLVSYVNTGKFHSFIVDIYNALERIKEYIIKEDKKNVSALIILDNVVSCEGTIAQYYGETLFTAVPANEFWIQWAGFAKAITNDYDECINSMQIIIDNFKAQNPIFNENTASMFTTLCCLFFGKFHKSIIEDTDENVKAIVESVSMLLMQAGQLISQILADPSVSDIVKNNINNSKTD